MAINYPGKALPGILEYDLEYIQKTHPLYKMYLPRWTYLGDAYTGGYDHFLGKYLEPYYYESTDDYMKRLRQVALDNHCRSVIGIYNSFLYRKSPKRNLGMLENLPAIEQFYQDADLDGRSFDQFMRDVATYAMVYGVVWVAIDKPVSNAYTRADELAQGIRPYATMFTPENVLDWNYERTESGLYRLNYVKLKEETQKEYTVIREYTLDTIRAFKVGADKSNDVELIQEQPNEIGMIPICPVYAQRGNKRGIGISLVNDIADIQRSIYEEYSEIEQIIRLTNHPALVKTAGTDASAGAGAIIQVEDGIDPNLRPYLLQPNGASIDSVLKSISQKVESIDRMASLGGIRSVESRRLSGVGLQTEFQMLNARLADIALNLEHAEEMIWRQFAMYMGMAFDGEINYPRSFSIQDKANDINMLKLAKDSNISDPYILKEIDEKIFETLFEEDYETHRMAEESAPYEENMMETQMMETQPQAQEHSPVTSPEQLITHFRQMIEEGYSNEEINQLHPELARLFSGSNSS